jgi:hypothetical protein
MKLFGNAPFFMAMGILLAACSNSQPAARQATVAADDPDIEVKRTIVVTGDGQCQLKMQKGRDDPELFTPKSCALSKDATDTVTAVTVSFDAPCKQYQFKNLIGDLYFLDEKAIGARNAACPVESFNASYGWSLEKA